VSVYTGEYTFCEYTFCEYTFCEYTLRKYTFCEYPFCKVTASLYSILLKAKFESSLFVTRLLKL
jgi:hypothetical protein